MSRQQGCTEGQPCTKRTCDIYCFLQFLQEHAGNDPSTQLVPSGGGSGWTKPEEQPPPQQQPTQPEVRQSALTAGSNWASSAAQPRPGVPQPQWTPPVRDVPHIGPPRGSYPVDRHLNPEEYPSLAATAKAQAAAARPKPATEQQASNLQSSLTVVI